jgi:DNA-binding transcriptional regulator GbsR (MarR family)
MHDAELEFIERMGRALEAEGMPRIAGRLFGLLLLRDGPFSLDELATGLQVSRASISTNGRLLERSGIAERTGLPGDRRDYYCLAPDAPDRVFEAARTRTRGMRELLETSAAALPPGLERGRERLEGMAALYGFFEGEMSSMLERWRARGLEGTRD